MPGWTDVAPGTYLVCGSNMTRCSPETKLGRSVKWYTELNPSPKRPVATSLSSFEACTETGTVGRGRGGGATFCRQNTKGGVSISRGAFSYGETHAGKIIVYTAVRISCLFVCCFTRTPVFSFHVVSFDTSFVFNTSIASNASMTLSVSTALNATIAFNKPIAFNTSTRLTRLSVLL